MFSLSTSFKRIAPNTLGPSATTSGVPPSRAMLSTAVLMPSGMMPPAFLTYSSMASCDPFRIFRPSQSIPLMRVSALKGMNDEPAGARMSLPRTPSVSLQRSTMLRPSGVSSAREESIAASARSALLTPSAGMNSVAILLPSVMVPVLSIRTTSTSPAASTALPLRAMTLCWSSLSIPAMPMAGRRPPMVVGIKQTRRATRTGTDTTMPI